MFGWHEEAFLRIVGKFQRPWYRFVLGVLAAVGSPVFRFFVLEVDGAFAASAIESFGPDLSYVSSVVVAPPFRRRGYAKRILAACHDAAAKRRSGTSPSTSSTRRPGPRPCTTRSATGRSSHASHLVRRTVGDVGFAPSDRAVRAVRPERRRAARGDRPVVRPAGPPGGPTGLGRAVPRPRRGRPGARLADDGVGRRPGDGTARVGPGEREPSHGRRPLHRPRDPGRRDPVGRRGAARDRARVVEIERGDAGRRGGPRTRTCGRPRGSGPPASRWLRARGPSRGRPASVDADPAVGGVDVYLMPAVVGGGLGDIAEVLDAGRGLARAGFRTILFRLPGRPLPPSVDGPWDLGGVERVSAIGPRATNAITVTPNWGVSAAPDRPGRARARRGLGEGGRGGRTTLRPGTDPPRQPRRVRPDAHLDRGERRAVEGGRRDGPGDRRPPEDEGVPGGRRPVPPGVSPIPRVRPVERAPPVPDVPSDAPVRPGVSGGGPGRAGVAATRPDGRPTGGPTGRVGLVCEPRGRRSGSSGPSTGGSAEPGSAGSSSGPPAHSRFPWTRRSRGAPPVRWAPASGRRRSMPAGLRVVTGSRTLLEAVQLGRPFLYFNGVLGDGPRRQRHRPEKVRALVRGWRARGVSRTIVRDIDDFSRGRRVAEVVRAAASEPGWSRAFPRTAPSGEFPPGLGDGVAYLVAVATELARGTTTAPDLVRAAPGAGTCPPQTRSLSRRRPIACRWPRTVRPPRRSRRPWSGERSTSAPART